VTSVDARVVSVGPGGIRAGVPCKLRVSSGLAALFGRLRTQIATATFVRVKRVPSRSFKRVTRDDAGWSRMLSTLADIRRGDQHLGNATSTIIPGTPLGGGKRLAYLCDLPAQN
jgi:hypothetical protein